MKINLLSITMLLGLACFSLPTTAKPTVAPIAPQKVNFDRDIRPILSENCFACHGFDEKKRVAGLRLDTVEGAFQRRPSGKAPFVAVKPEASEALLRMMRKDALQMPPANTNKKLTAKQIALVRQWIQEGAKYEKHWAFVPPQRPQLPKVQNVLWSRNPIDQFLLARMEQEKIKPSQEANRRTLIRRLSLDLRGLLPSLEEVDAFLKDRRENSYERLVDTFLADPHYGERMTLQWLDLARYADTHGFHIDPHRDMWRWREWVIQSFNKNLSYDKFVTYQIAGDLFPNPTLEQKIATGFSRNHPINFEGGAIPEEYQTAYVIDRVDCFSTAILGMSLRCGQCHTHKYDPFTQKEYYQLFAYFNNIPEQGLDGTKGNAAPFMKAPSEEQTTMLAQYTQKVRELSESLQKRASDVKPALAEWERTTAPSLARIGASTSQLTAYFDFEGGAGTVNDAPQGKRIVSTLKGSPKWEEGKVGRAISLDGVSYVDLGTALQFDRKDKVSYGAWVYPETNEAMAPISRMDGTGSVQGWDVYLQEGRVFVHLIHKWDSNAIRVNTKETPISIKQWSHVFVTYDGSGKAAGVKVYVNGKLMGLDYTHDSLTGTIVTPEPALIGRRASNAFFKGKIDELRFYQRELSAAEVLSLVTLDAVRHLLATAPEKRNAEQTASLSKFYLENYDTGYKEISSDYTNLEKKRKELDEAIPTTMVMQENETGKTRKTHILMRGEYDKPAEEVAPGVPSFLPAPAPNAPANRLGLAQWLIQPNHPLTARVAVNHFWQMIFGTGIVKTAEDFGIQGERPSHPELLDWLATEFVQSGWDVKHIMRLIVTSSAYRQSSHVTKEQYTHDPENRLLARGARYRLPGEFIRDISLQSAGLLIPKIGGQSVRPYHPTGLWEEIGFGGGFSAQTYVQDHGEDLYRRGMYTFWKRTCPPPSLATFDAPEREFCIVRRSVTNTPLQALVLMNDPTYVEASRKLAERLMTEGGTVPKQRIQFAYRLLLSRYATAQEMQVVIRAFNNQMTLFRSDSKLAEKLLTTGESKRNEKLDMTELSAWTMVASMLLNLDETLNRN